MPISREQWQAISPLLARAMELPDAGRETWLRELDVTQPALSPLLRRLLAADRRADEGRAFETASVLAGGKSVAASEFAIDRLVGPYRLSRPLGRGGMGEVWLARQVEGGITRDVALKLPMLFGKVDAWRERFRLERDILASLQHPNIATLFDAGVADVAGGTGQPYLAMEYIDGPSLLDYAALRALGARDRVLLFRQVLAAVGCAHRQLVIHRDLKPSNILVTHDGQVKLLDFGIAKLIEDGQGAVAAGDLTRLGGRLLTYRYAAPEQVLGEPLGTATDVYALGVVLHELLTGLSPYRRVRDGAAPGLADFQQEEFAQPSSLARVSGVDGDLDAIVLKALRRQPADRYGTVEQFDDDLLRHLERRPVLARRGSRRYRAGRFIVRNRVPLVAGLVMTLSLVTGLVVAESQRRSAVAAQARAERHFASVRGLANTFIYDIEQDLRGLAGTLPVREKLARTSVKYLDSLSAESQLDTGLLAELAGGYRRVGEIFAGNGDGSLGNIEAGLANLQKAAALFDALRAQGVTSRRILDDERRVHYSMATIHLGRGDPRWEQEDRRSIEIARQLADGPGATAYDRVTAAGMLAEHLQKLDLAPPRVRRDSAPILEEAESRLNAVAPVIGSDVRARGNLAITHFTLAEWLLVPDATAANLARARDGLQTAVNLLRALETEMPDDVVYASQRDMVQGVHADALFRLGRIHESEAEVADVLVRTRAAMARDPYNVDFLLLHWQILSQGAETAYRAGRPAEAARRAKEAWLLAARASPENFGKLGESFVSQATLDYFGGLALLAGTPPERALACRRLRAVEDFMPRFRQERPEEAAHSTRFGELATALRRCPARAAVPSAAK